MASCKDSPVKTLIWDKNSLLLIDQRKLPFEKVYVRCSTAEEVAAAIKDMVVRGAPAIGVSAAYGVALSALGYNGGDRKVFLELIDKKIKILSESRPTAVNLFWALQRVSDTLKKYNTSTINEIKEALVYLSEEIELEDVDINKKIGSNSLELFKNISGKLRLLTHCNAGALATAGYGTALGVIRSLHSESKVESVLVDETRPYLQGARLTAWELYEEKIPFFVITDNMAGYYMAKSEVDAVIVGADRIAANGDAANKIGTMALSIMAGYFKIPFYIAAPISTIDMETENGTLIPIEQRNEKEVRNIMGKEIIPEYMPVLNPAFDVTGNENISAIITEKGILYPPFTENIKIIAGK